MNTKGTTLYDKDFIKALPIMDVLQDYGIKVKGGHFAVRSERTPSCKVYPETNSWSDFGGANIRGGSVIDLARAMEGLSFKEALQALGQRYNAPTLQRGGPSPTYKALSHAQYESIGLIANPAYKNILLPQYSDSFTYTAVMNIKEKYDMPMNKLFEVEPLTYASILKREALPYVRQLEQSYKTSLLHYANAKDEHGPTSTETELSLRFAQKASTEYTTAQSALAAACKHTDLEPPGKKPDFEVDLKNIQKVSIEIGDFPYRDLKALPGDTWHMKVPYTLYQAFSRAITYGDIQLDTPYSVHVKKDTATVSYKAEHENTIKGMFASMEQMGKYQQQQTAQSANAPAKPALGAAPAL